MAADSEEVLPPNVGPGVASNVNGEAESDVVTTDGCDCVVGVAVGVICVCNLTCSVCVATMCLEYASSTGGGVDVPVVERGSESADLLRPTCDECCA